MIPAPRRAIELPQQLFEPNDVNPPPVHKKELFYAISSSKSLFKSVHNVRAQLLLSA